MGAPVVTISASYGAGGSVVAPALADRLGWPFVDRLVTADVSSEATATIAGRSEERLSPAEAAAGPQNRFLTSLARAAGVGAMMAPDSVIDTDLDLRERTESALRSVHAGGGAVVLGRAGAVILADHPRSLHVRLDGPVERRVVRAAEIEQIGLSDARSRQAQTDRARNLFVRRLYRRDPEDPGLYHVILDTTIIAVDAVVDLLATIVEVTIGRS